LVLCTLCCPKNEQDGDWILWESLETHLRANDHIKRAKKAKKEAESEAAANVLKDSKGNKRLSSPSNQIINRKNPALSSKNIAKDSTIEFIEPETIQIEEEPPNLTWRNIIIFK